MKEPIFLNKIIDKLTSLSNAPQPEIRHFFRNEITWLFQKALLSGEYDESALEKLNKIRALLQPIRRNTIKDGETIKGNPIEKLNQLWGNYQSNKETDFIERHYLPVYIDLVQDLQNGLQNLDEGRIGKLIDLSVYEGYSNFKQFAETKEDNRSTIENYNSFLIGILLTYCDEYLECSKEILKILRRINWNLSKLSLNKHSEEVIELYMHKAEFLEYKILLRGSHITREGEQDEQTNPRLSENNAYNEFRERTEKHYNLLAFEDHVKMNQVTVAELKKDIADLKIEHLHNFNKYFHKLCKRDLEYRKKQIDSVVEKLVQKQEQISNTSLFDKIAFKSVHKLLLNSSFQLELQIEREKHFSSIISHFKKYLKKEVDDAESQKLKEYIQKAHLIAEDNSFQDFYCDITLIKFLDSLNEFLLESPECLVSKDNEIDVKSAKKRVKDIIRHIQTSYSNILERVSVSLSKNMSYESKAVYMTKKECYVNYTWKKIDQEPSFEGQLFLDSSYVLPNNFEKISKKVESSKGFLMQQMKFIEESFDIAISRLEVEDNINTFEEKMKGNEFRVIQTVALFVSIATFVLINVKIFENRTGLESFAILIGLGACFVVFNLILYFMVFLQYKAFRKDWGKVIATLFLMALPIYMMCKSHKILRDEDLEVGKNFKNLQSEVDKHSPEIDLLKSKIVRDSIEMATLKSQLQKKTGIRF
ncbi:hypothetical protein JMG10_03505 [Nostoc ellipsosporum NOK]|nr:hypothetical protein [Nostoc ellipsosporum NOK]